MPPLSANPGRGSFPGIASLPVSNVSAAVHYSCSGTRRAGATTCARPVCCTARRGSPSACDSHGWPPDPTSRTKSSARSRIRRFQNQPKGGKQPIRQKTRSHRLSHPLPKVSRQSIVGNPQRNAWSRSYLPLLRHTAKTHRKAEHRIQAEKERRTRQERSKGWKSLAQLGHRVCRPRCYRGGSFDFRFVARLGLLARFARSHSLMAEFQSAYTSFAPVHTRSRTVRLKY